MGKALSKCCIECFVYSEEEESKTIQISSTPLLKGEVQALAEQPECSDAFDLSYINRKLSEAQSEFVQHIGVAMASSGFAEVLDKDNIQIASQEVSEGYSLKFRWAIPFTVDQYVEFNFEEDRRTWEKNIDEYSEICWVDSSTLISHTKFKKIMIFSPRDLLVATRIIKMDQGTLVLNTSIENSQYAPETNFVRAQLDIGGFFASPLDTPDENGNLTQILSITKGHFGGNISATMVKKFICSNFPKFIATQSEAVRKYLEKTKS